MNRYRKPPVENTRIKIKLNGERFFARCARIAFQIRTLHFMALRADFSFAFMRYDTRLFSCDLASNKRIASVTHSAMRRTLNNISCNRRVADYVENYFANSSKRCIILLTSSTTAACILHAAATCIQKSISLFLDRRIHFLVFAGRLTSLQHDD